MQVRVRYGSDQHAWLACPYRPHLLEVQHQVLALVVVKADGLDLAVHHRGGLRGWLHDGLSLCPSRKLHG